MINPVHPDTPHISAVRAWRFAQGLAGLGHRVVLLTAGSAAEDGRTGSQLAAHDWTKPYVLAVDAGKQVKTRLPSLFSKIRTVWCMLRDGGAQGEWVHNSLQAIQQGAEHFRPDVVWCTFGMLESVVVARRIADALVRPWVLDIKDNWELYVPSGLRRLMAWRTRGWAAVTANAKFTADKATKWQHAQAKIIYSGVDEAFFVSSARSDVKGERSVNLVGSLYFPEHLAVLLAGIGRWHGALPEEERRKVTVRYLGGDVAMFTTAAREWIPQIRIEARGYVPIQEMAVSCRGAAVNMYVAHHGGFHHKLLELLACGRPLLAYPGESDESRNLVRSAGGELLEPASAEQVGGMLADIFSRLPVFSQGMAADTPLRRYAWENQSRALEEVLLNAKSVSQRQ